MYWSFCWRHECVLVDFIKIFQWLLSWNRFDRQTWQDFWKGCTDPRTTCQEKQNRRWLWVLWHRWWGCQGTGKGVEVAGLSRCWVWKLQCRYVSQSDQVHLKAFDKAGATYKSFSWTWNPHWDSKEVGVSETGLSWQWKFLQILRWGGVFLFCPFDGLPPATKVAHQSDWPHGSSRKGAGSNPDQLHQWLGKWVWQTVHTSMTMGYPTRVYFHHLKKNTKLPEENSGRWRFWNHCLEKPKLSQDLRVDPSLQAPLLGESFSCLAKGHWSLCVGWPDQAVPSVFQKSLAISFATWQLQID